MIANTLIFLLGMLITALAAMVLSPVVWRKAQSLARREFEATIPISANEIRAEFDRVRAEAAVSVRRQEVQTADMREKTAKAEAERGRVVVEAAELRIRQRLLDQTIEEQDAALASIRTALAAREADIVDLTAELSEVRHAADQTLRDLEALEARYRDLDELAEGRSLDLVAANERIERLEQSLDPDRDVGTEDEDRMEASAAEITDLRHTLDRERLARLGETARGTQSDVSATRVADRSAAGPGATTNEPPRRGSPRYRAAIGRRELPALDPAAEADIRERISDVAARVIRMTALAEGPASPLASLLRPAASGGESAPSNAGLTLADRVRLLAEAERNAGPDAPSPSAKP